MLYDTSDALEPVSVYILQNVLPVFDWPKSLLSFHPPSLSTQYLLQLTLLPLSSTCPYHA